MCNHINSKNVTNLTEVIDLYRPLAAAASFLFEVSITVVR